MIEFIDMTKPPRSIFRQDYSETGIAFMNEVTWSEDKINDNNIKHIRYDLHKVLIVAVALAFEYKKKEESRKNE